MTIARVPASAPLTRLTLFGRAWCHLCDDMLAELTPLVIEFGVEVNVIDIDTDPALIERYDERVPVLVLNEVELSGYRLDTARVRQALALHSLNDPCIAHAAARVIADSDSDAR